MPEETKPSAEPYRRMNGLASEGIPVNYPELLRQGPSLDERLDDGSLGEGLLADESISFSKFLSSVFATKTDMEDETANKIVLADKARHSPGTAKMWANWTLSLGVVTLQNSYNVSSLTDNGVGDFTINYTTAFSNDDYALVGTTQRDTAVGNALLIFALKNGVAPATASARVVTVNANAQLEDPERVGVGAWGDL